MSDSTNACPNCGGPTGAHRPGCAWHFDVTRTTHAANQASEADTVPGYPMTTKPFRPESPDDEVPVVWANNASNEFPVAWWNTCFNRLVAERPVTISRKGLTEAQYAEKLARAMAEDRSWLAWDGRATEHIVRLGVARALSEVAVRVIAGTNPGGPNTVDPEPDQGKDRAQYRLWGVMKREVYEAVRATIEMSERIHHDAAYQPTDVTGPRQRVLGDSAYTAPQDRATQPTEPTAYAAFLELPNDAAVRAAFLAEHPEVAEYLTDAEQVEVRRYRDTQYASAGGTDNTHGGNTGMQRLELNNVVRTTGNAFQGTTVKHAPGPRGGGVREEALTPEQHKRRYLAAVAQLPEYADKRGKIPTRELFEALAARALHDAAEDTPTNRQLAERWGVHEDTVRRAIDRMRAAALQLYGTWSVPAERPKQRRPKWWWRKRRGWSDVEGTRQGFTATFVSPKTGEEVTVTGRTLKPIVDAMVEHGYDRAHGFDREGLEMLALYMHAETSKHLDHPDQRPNADLEDLDETWNAAKERVQ